MMEQAIEMHVELVSRSGKNVPAPSHQFAFTVEDASAEELCTCVEVELPQSVEA